MAVRTPFVVETLAGNEPTIRQMTTAEIDAVKLEIVHKALAKPNHPRLNMLGEDPDSAGYEKSYFITELLRDDRSGASAATTSTGDGGNGVGDSTDTPDNEDYTDPGNILALFQTFKTIRESVPGNKAYALGGDSAGAKDSDNSYTYWPIYYVDEGSNTIQAKSMSFQDIRDTFVYPAMDAYYTYTAGYPGRYYVSSADTFVNHRKVSDVSIFTDTIADVSAYTPSGIPEAQEQYTTENDYKLWIRDDVDSNKSGGFPPFIRINPDDNTEFKQVDSADIITPMVMDYIYEQKTRWFWRIATSGTLNQMVDYYNAKSIPATAGAGVINHGSMSDTRVFDDSVGRKFLNLGTQDPADDIYRAQRFPTGTPINSGTFTLVAAYRDSADNKFIKAGRPD